MSLPAWQLSRRGGRVVYRDGLENRWGESSRGFESLPLRQNNIFLSASFNLWEQFKNMPITLLLSV